MRSDLMKKGVQRVAHRTLLKSLGLTDEEIGRPIIGIVNSLNPSVRLGWINLLCATLLMYALGRIHGKKEALEKERLLHE